MTRDSVARKAIRVGGTMLNACGLNYARQLAMASKVGLGPYVVMPESLLGRKRLFNIQYCIERVLGDMIPGDLIETGVWRGGACILMRAVLAAHGVENRRVWVADSFCGLPPPDPAYPADDGDRHHEQGYLAVSRLHVEDNFDKYGLLDGQVAFLEGWFRDTLPVAPIDKLAILRLDGDMYGSTIEALSALYPKLSPGGFCIIDDYRLPGCRLAVNEYRRAFEIIEPMEDIDWTGVYWRK